MSVRRGLIVLVACAAAGPALALAPAHVPIAGGSGFYAGLLHPLYVPEHTLAVVGIGLLVGQQGEGRTALQVGFAVALIAGLAAIALAAGPSHANGVLVVSAALCGLLVALARPLPAALGWPLAAVTGAAIGLDSPPEVIDLRIATVMLIGTGLGAIMLLTVVVEGVSWLRRDWQRIAVRVAGSWTAAAAILVLALRLAT
jgi:urease accessory protein